MRYQYKDINIYAANFRIPKFMEEILTELEGEIESNIIIVRDFNILLSKIKRATRRRLLRK
jgi:hypothetical protein